MVLGAFLGLLALYCLWFRRSTSDKQKISEGTVLASLYWLAQLPATFFPGVALTDPGTGIQMPHLFGIEFNRLALSITIIFPLLILGYFSGAKIA